MSIGTCQLEFPDDFDDFAWEVEAKGWIQGVVAIVNHRRYALTFYDPIRLAQDIENELGSGAVFFERNLVVVPSVTRTHMEAAVDVLARGGHFVKLVSEDDVRR